VKTQREGTLRFILDVHPLELAKRERVGEKRKRENPTLVPGVHPLELAKRKRVTG
jgi:hypothetical protein